MIQFLLSLSIALTLNTTALAQKSNSNSACGNCSRYEHCAENASSCSVCSGICSGRSDLGSSFNSSDHNGSAGSKKK